jgi:hypothetical protein
MGTARTIATTAPPRMATGKGSPAWVAIRPVVYADVPQNAACPNDSRPV